ncbi:hypothetical protein Tco_0725412 [Tanacetum coccineum]|uniref:Uncharacterized protein n=1 Tax=Tanacetum coccineum TaxID=301880 RepID=A0ABQ4YDP1_9ASTR
MVWPSVMFWFGVMVLIVVEINKRVEMMEINRIKEKPFILIGSPSGFQTLQLKDITIAETKRYLDEYLHPFEPSKKYQVNSDIVHYVPPYIRPEPTVTHNDTIINQNDHPVQNEDDDQTEQLIHTNDEAIIDHQTNTEQVHPTEPSSSPAEDSSVVLTTEPIPLPTSTSNAPSTSNPSLAIPAPQLKSHL